VGHDHRGEYKTLTNHIEASDEFGNSLGVVFATATPFDTPRLMKTKVNGRPVAPQDLPPDLQPRGCFDEATGRGTCDQSGWITALRRQCGVDNCANFTDGDLESFLHEDPHKLAVVKRTL